MKRVFVPLMIAVSALPGAAWSQCRDEPGCARPRIMAANAGERRAWLEKVEVGRRDYENFAERAIRAYLARSGNGDGPSRRGARALSAPSRYLDDPTLRKDDIVVTEEGFLVFKGSSAARPSESDFIRFSEAEGKKRFLQPAAASDFDPGGASLRGSP